MREKTTLRVLKMPGSYKWLVQATDNRQMWVRFSLLVPKIFFDFYKKICYNIYVRLRKRGYENVWWFCNSDPVWRDRRYFGSWRWMSGKLWIIWSLGQAVKTSPFHGEVGGSTPPGITREMSTLRKGRQQVRAISYRLRQLKQS